MITTACFDFAQDEGYRRFGRHFLFVDAHLRLYPSRIERPQIGGLLDLVVLMQPFPDTGDLREIPIHVQLVCGAGADLAVHRHQHE